MKKCICDLNLEFEMDTLEKINMDFCEKNYTDGLPIIPPTRERVERFYRHTKRKPEDLLAVLPPRYGKATVEKIAINAVMAGCLPNYMPILEAIIIAMSKDKFNLPAINATTHPVAICAILNGPICDKLGFNSGVGCLGPGSIANATVGRAIRLCLINIAGAVPGIGDHATHGSPAKYSYCFAENEKENPWDPLHVERGFSRKDNTVTVIGVESPQNVNDHRSEKAEDLLDTIIHTASTAGCNNSHVPGEILLIIGPEHAEIIKKDGWEKEDIKEYVHENALVPAELADRGGRKLDKKWLKNGEVPITRSPDDVIVVVAGGPGRHSMVAHGFGGSSESVTVKIDM